MTYITRIANKRILAKYFLYSLQINYLNWKLSASRSIFSCYATITQERPCCTHKFSYFLCFGHIWPTKRLLYNSVICLRVISLWRNSLWTFLNDPDFITKSLYTTVIDQERDLLISKATAHPFTSLFVLCLNKHHGSRSGVQPSIMAPKALELSSALLRYWPNPVFWVSTVQSVIKRVPSSLLFHYQSCHPITVNNIISTVDLLKVLSAKFYFHKPITVHLELYLFYRFIHFLLYIGQYWLWKTWWKLKPNKVLKSFIGKPFIEYVLI